MTLPPHGQDSDLFEPHGFRGSQPVNSYVAKVFNQQSCARLDSGLRNHEEKYAFAFEPPIGVCKKVNSSLSFLPWPYSQS